MHPFSIDYITRASEMTIPCEQPDGDSADNCRVTPSPSDSGVGSDNWPEKDDTKAESDRDSVAKALLNLDRKAQIVSDQEVNTEKPAHSYIALISMAILSSPDKKMLLCDIYQYIMDNFTYYNNQDKAWRNSIRHNLSLNECFIKNGRADNGKGNFWSIHPACVKDFSKGDFRRRQARRRARKSTQEPGSSSLSMPYRYKVGYVPMTASHISFHPYSTGSPSFYYPQATVASLPSGAHGQTSPSSLSLYSKPSCPSNFYGRGDVSPPEYYSGTSTGNTPQSPFATMSASSVQRYFAEETRLAIATQGLSPQHMQTPLQFQNW